MNRRIHYLDKIEYIMPHIYSDSMRTLLQGIQGVLLADEDELTDLYSQIDFLERSIGGIMLPPPESDVYMDEDGNLKKE